MIRIYKTAIFITIFLIFAAHPAIAQTPQPTDGGTQVQIPGDERYKVYEEAVVVDLQLGLMWARHDNQGPIGWLDAFHYCRQGPPELLGKYDDWRMPTLRELAGLYAWSQYLEPVDTLCGKKIKAPNAFELTCDWIWASEKKLNTASAFNLRSGYVFEERLMRKTGYRALPIRKISDEELAEIKQRLAENETPETGQ